MLLLYNSLLIKWFTSVEVEIWTKVLTKKCLYAKILKTGIFMFEYRFFYIARIFWEQTIDLGNSTKCYKVTCFPKLENWHVAEGTLYRFHSVHMTILFDLSSFLIRFVFGNSLIETSFEAKVIKWNWKLKTLLLFRIFWLKVYLHYKRITSQNVPSKTQIKNFFIS